MGENKFDIAYGVGLLPNWSEHGAAIDQLIKILHIFMIVLFVSWGIFLLYCLIKFRSRPGHKASYQSATSKLPKYAEIGVVLFETFLLVGLSFPIWSRYRLQKPDAEKALHVRVVAQAFQWNIHYPGEDGKFGPTRPELVNNAFNPLGIDKTHPDSYDDFWSVGTMNVPKGVPVVADITSKDVIHSFAIPVLRVKQDANPGLVTPVWFTATKTGKISIVCSQLCGNGHSRMFGRVQIQEPEEFKKWMAEKKRPFKPKEKKSENANLDIDKVTEGASS
ncbi:MAG: cytochrome c oxidase subunit II [Deltaproteobacteria bacterium]|nr:cytochrome c oxidase subunit II [Deltaproteobacteria bacterium]